MDDIIDWFDRPRVPDELVGGKNASLRAMIGAGLPVPMGFAVTTVAWDRRPTGGEAPDWLRTQVTDAYRQLSARRGREAELVAVRSSATCEDRPEASFAGAHDTFLGVRSAAQVVARVMDCWASLWSERAVAYRQRMLEPGAEVAMSVGVQLMVRPRAAGVALTLDPLTGDRSVVAIDAAWGLGEGVVTGAVNPDSFLADKASGRITRRVISTKPIRYAVHEAGGVLTVEVDPARRDQPCVSDDDVRSVAELACRAESRFGCPQDVEWAIEADDAAGTRLWALQSRPETVWSRRSGIGGRV